MHVSVLLACFCCLCLGRLTGCCCCWLNGLPLQNMQCSCWGVPSASCTLFLYPSATSLLSVILLAESRSVHAVASEMTCVPLYC